MYASDVAEMVRAEATTIRDHAKRATAAGHQQLAQDLVQQYERLHGLADVLDKLTRTRKRSIKPCDLPD